METKRYLKTSESLRRMHLIIVFHTTSDRTWLLGSHIKRCIICKGRHSKIAYVNATYRKIASKHGSMQEDYQGVGDCRIHLTHKEKMTIFLNIGSIRKEHILRFCVLSNYWYLKNLLQNSGKQRLMKKPFILIKLKYTVVASNFNHTLRSLKSWTLLVIIKHKRKWNSISL